MLRNSGLRAGTLFALYLVVALWWHAAAVAGNTPSGSPDPCAAYAKSAACSACPLAGAAAQSGASCPTMAGGAPEACADKNGAACADKAGCVDRPAHAASSAAGGGCGNCPDKAAAGGGGTGCGAGGKQPAPDASV